MDALICTVCAYGKAYRKSRQNKGVNNKKKLSTATDPGQVV